MSHAPGGCGGVASCTTKSSRAWVAGGGSLDTSATASACRCYVMTRWRVCHDLGVTMSVRVGCCVNYMGIAWCVLVATHHLPFVRRATPRARNCRGRQVQRAEVPRAGGRWLWAIAATLLWRWRPSRWQRGRLGKRLWRRGREPRRLDSLRCGHRSRSGCWCRGTRRSSQSWRRGRRRSGGTRCSPLHANGS